MGRTKVSLKRGRMEGGGSSSDKSAQETAQSSHPLTSSHAVLPLVTGTEDRLTKLSLEILCHILSFLPLSQLLKLDSLSKRLHEAVTLHLRLSTSIDFIEDQIWGWMPSKLNDTNLACLLQRCGELRLIHGFHSIHITKRRQRGMTSLSVPGIVAAFTSCPNLCGVEISDIFLLEAVLVQLPKIHILKSFRNRNGRFPVPHNNRISLAHNPGITCLHLEGVSIPGLPRMDYVKELFLKWVQFTKTQPFQEFRAPMMQTFVMRHCAGPANDLQYVPLVTRLAAARFLTRLELVRVPFLGGLIQHVAEDSWRENGFRQLQKITFSACKDAIESDIGYLLIASSQRIEEVNIQPSLTKDSLFSALNLAQVSFPHFETLHLGYVDSFTEQAKWSSHELTAHGLSDVITTPSLITDVGMHAVGQVFPLIQRLTIYNCPHLHLPVDWLLPSGGTPSWRHLKDLHLWRCHAVRLLDLCKLIPLLPALESLILEQMFKEPPKGCSRVGLSAGTGLGVSSALVANVGQEVAAANQDVLNNNNDMANQNVDGEVVNENADQNVNSGRVSDEEEVLNVSREMETSEKCENIDDAKDGNSQGNIHTDRKSNQIAPCTSGYRRKKDKDTGRDSSLHNGRDTSSHNHYNNLNTYTDDSNTSSSQIGSCDVNCTDSESIAHRTRSCHRKFLEKQDSNPIDSETESSNVSPSRQSKGKSLHGKKKGLVKKSKAHSTPSSVDRSCQAVSEEIRNCTRNAKSGHREENLDIDHNCLTLHDQKTSSKSCDDSDVSPTSYPSSRRGVCKTRDQSTSTSDPVIEEDYIQVLSVSSSSLISLTLRVAGITDLFIQECPKLQLLSATGCRVLKNVLVKSAPRLTRVSFNQCCKLRHADLVDEICRQPGDKNRLIFLRPMKNYDSSAMEQLLCRSREYDYHVCLLQDHSPDPSKTKHNHVRAAGWLDLITNINFELLKFHDFQEVERSCTVKKHYPWGRHLYRLQGLNMDGSLWELLTDFPWLRDLYQSLSRKASKDHTGGIYCPHSFGHINTPGCMGILEQSIAEAKQSHRPLHIYSILVYVNTCDVSGDPVSDIYV